MLAAEPLRRQPFGLEVPAGVGAGWFFVAGVGAGSGGLTKSLGSTPGLILISSSATVWSG